MDGCTALCRQKRASPASIFTSAVTPKPQNGWPAPQSLTTGGTTQKNDWDNDPFSPTKLGGCLVFPGSLIASRHKGRMTDRPRYKMAFLLSHALFFVYAGIFWIVCDANFFAHPYESIVSASGFALFFGIPVGFACSSFVILWFSRKTRNVR